MAAATRPDSRKGIVMAMLRPEWAQGFCYKLREYYLTTHTSEDLQSWERHADETARAISIHRLSPEPRAAGSQVSIPPSKRLQGFLPSAAPIGVEETL